MGQDDADRRVGEILAAVVANALAVPVIVGFVVLGAGVLVGRSVLDIIGQARKSSPPSRRRRRNHRPVRMDAARRDDRT